MFFYIVLTLIAIVICFVRNSFYAFLLFKIFICHYHTYNLYMHSYSNNINSYTHLDILPTLLQSSTHTNHTHTYMKNTVWYTKIIFYVNITYTPKYSMVINIGHLHTEMTIYSSMPTT